MHPLRSRRGAACAATVLLLFVAAGCGRREQARPIEARLTSQTAWAPYIPAPSVSIADEACDHMTTDHQAAIRTLVSRPDCTDAVIERLEALAGPRRHGPLWSDLSAAYYLRAQRRDRPSDLLRALNAATRAVSYTPRLLEAKFNRALAQESLGLTKDAIASWGELQAIDRSPWGTEAGERRKKLSETPAIPQSKTNPQWIASYPAAAQRYIEDEVLPAWARAVSDDDARRQLESAHDLATQLARATDDRYALDVVSSARTSRGETSRQLRQAHLLLRDARANERVKPRDAAAQFQRAEELFTAAGSPAAAGAQLGHAIADWFSTFDAARAREKLTPVDQLARARNYWNLIARVEANRANFLFYENRQVDALEHYDLALAAAERVRDRENIANMHVRKAGILRILGQRDAASREALRALRVAPGVVDVQSRHHLLGENAAGALAHGFPAIALVYQNEAVELIDRERRKPGLDAQRKVLLQNNLSAALRQRAAIQLGLDRPHAAQQDLQRAIELTKKPANRSDEVVRNTLNARIQEIAGQSSMRDGDPRRAVQAFTAALENIFAGEHRTFRATVLMQRAEAHHALRDTAAAERDLLAAIDQLRIEQEQLLAGRRLGAGEALWTPYFSRFRELYERLIRQLVDQERKKEAYTIAEQFRAFEPLTLTLQLGVASDSVRRWTHDGKTLSLATIQDKLPPDTFLVEFSVLPDRTYVWIVGRKHFDVVTQRVRSDVIDQWNADLRRSAREQNSRSFVLTAEKIYDALLADPLRAIRKLSEAPRLIFVPDGSIHGLPLSALRDRSSGRYVIDEHVVSIAASATFYLFSRERDELLAATETHPSALLIGNPTFGRQLDLAQGLAPLPWAQSEIAGIAAVYGSDAVPIDPGRATVPEFLRKTPQSTIVHFAGHAVSNPEAPFRSFLLFAPSPDDPGILFAEEILMRLRPQQTVLVVLSACSSAGGVRIGPEGLAPLVRPLIASGIPAVAGSLWNIQDNRQSGELLAAFHRHFRDGRDAAQAMRLAQLEIARKTDFAHGSVLTWAPFQIVGHASSPYR